MTDPIKSPPHYRSNSDDQEAYEVIREWMPETLSSWDAHKWASAMKYLLRAGKKGEDPGDDIKKAVRWLQLLVDDDAWRDESLDKPVEGFKIGNAPFITQVGTDEDLSFLADHPDVTTTVISDTPVITWLESHDGPSNYDIGHYVHDGTQTWTWRRTGHAALSYFRFDSKARAESDAADD